MKHFLLTVTALLGLNSAYAKDMAKNVDLKVTENGFEPAEIKVKPGTHVVLKVIRTTDQTCATQIKINNKKTDLPLNKQVSVDAGTLKKGEIKFACGMDMLTGHIVTE